MKVLVDGRNLSLKTGTGVATYARNVCGVAKDAGYSVDVMYGEPFGFHKNPLFREISFFDVASERTSLAEKAAGTVASFYSPFLKANAFEIPMNGAVDSRNFASSLPPVDRFWNSNRIFQRADHAYANPYRLTSRFTRLENAFGSDVAHWTYPLPLRLERARNIYTIHDLVPLRLPFTTLDKKRAYYRMIDQICRDADAIVTVSETSRADILNMFDVPAAKVVNTYQSVSIPDKLLATDRQALETELLGAHGVRYKDYILFYGAIEPKKNIGRLIEAYLASGLDIPLLVVGKDGWLFKKDPALALIAQPSAGEPAAHTGSGSTGRERASVRRLNYVSFQQLVNLIRGARLVALPSLYEGFGLPIVEGMICGTPVLTANIGATAEVAGDAAVLVDPYDPRDIRDGLVALATNDGLRQRMVSAGHERIKAFSAARHAQKLSAVYDSVLKDKPTK